MASGQAKSYHPLSRTEDHFALDDKTKTNRIWFALEVSAVLSL
jgi:hypothetical protein